MAYASAYNDLSYRSFRRRVQTIELHLPAANHRGRPRLHAPREILNAVFFYVLKSGCPWRLFPREFSHWRSVYHWFRAWRIDGTWERLNAALCERPRARLGRRDPNSSAAIVDSQTAKTTEMAEAWARGSGPRRARRWTGRGCSRAEASKSCPPLGGRKDLRLDLPQPADEQGLREIVSQRGIRLRSYDALDGKAANPRLAIL
jgi:transposase